MVSCVAARRFAGELVNAGVLQVLNQLLQQELEGFGVQQKLLALSNTILQEVVTEEEAKREWVWSRSMHL